MTVEEIFNKVATHMVNGLMYHDELAEAFGFLGLYGYSVQQDYHHLEETNNYRRLSHYYSTHYHKLIVLEAIENPHLVPEIWVKYDTFSVDSATRKSAVKDFMTKWIKWERETKQFYTSMRQELVNIGELAAADKLEKYLKDVSDELEQAEKYLIELEAIGYDMVTIIDHQSSLHKKYKKKLGW